MADLDHHQHAIPSVPERIPIPCGCGCGRAAAHVIVRSGHLTLEIVSRHGAHYHTTYLRWGKIPSVVGSQQSGPDARP